MPIHVLLKAVSVTLAAGSLSFLVAEWRLYKGATAEVGRVPGSQGDRGRLIRRTVGSAILLTMAMLMFAGRLPQEGAPPAEVLSLFYYWSSIVGLAVLLGLVAMYDAIRGVKNLKTYVSAVQGRELAALAKQLKEGNNEVRSPRRDAIEKD